MSQYRQRRGFPPCPKTLPALRKAPALCRGCDLYCHATQVVFGAGPPHAAVIFVGEQPGDQEDLAGKPFVGPAGKLFDKALAEAGIDRDHVFVTNAVKHFKFEQRGKRRIHAKPNARQLNACRPWLEAEISAVQPKLIVCLGASAAQSLLGRQFRVTKDHGRIFNDTPWSPTVMATAHPPPSSAPPIRRPVSKATSFSSAISKSREKISQCRDYRAFANRAGKTAIPPECPDRRSK